ncbi:Nrx-1 [Bugula neritina]|uniref:Nrx-1 n=1 Tax=Bugula neritina TaxID=10212 RepID=A0A7J7IVI8_BUGNE|nr:Nrx-1 [Bugula neritina]
MAPITGPAETISLTFKTNSGEGLLFHTGDGGNYLNIGLKDAVVYIALQMGSGEKLEYLGRGRQFDDNLWHTLYVHRNVKMMHASVDGSYEISKSFAGNFHEINSRILFLGGASKLKNLPGVRTVQNFHGCLKNVSRRI